MKNYFFTAIAIVFICNIQAQDFLPGFNGFSKKKTTYLHMSDGTVVKGNLKKLKYEKGLLEEIKIKDLKDQKVKIKPKDINFLYLPPSGLAKLANFDKMIGDARTWNNKNLDQNLFKDGYAYFEKSDVRVKKKTKTLMVQLINPSFSEKIKVYQDPYAKKTTSIGVGPLKAGGIAKSYYVKKGDEIAIRLKKKDYDQEFKLFFGDCPAIIEKYGSDIKWSQFALHVFEYNELCK
ncbi:hypothetical protein [Aquimarina sp. RZ0]|uniref:hypothetical protein n=1 Tax=Aquimarina sp. RZ0 TaxID=2607730 RepID=UPI0011F1A4EB|nr:hypothetical protein [Aquimarina sp. RZ0]KAA1244492.1 hypothetical protein F0000_16020 [Aquimarina sp. RZ0]